MVYIYRTNQEWYQFLKVNGITQGFFLKKRLKLSSRGARKLSISKVPEERPN